MYWKKVLLKTLLEHICMFLKWCLFLSGTIESFFELAHNLVILEVMVPTTSDSQGIEALGPLCHSSKQTWVMLFKFLKNPIPYLMKLCKYSYIFVHGTVSLPICILRWPFINSWNIACHFTWFPTELIESGWNGMSISLFSRGHSANF